MSRDRFACRIGQIVPLEEAMPTKKYLLPLFAACLLASSLTAKADPVYTVTALGPVPIPGSSNLSGTRGNAINGSGQIAGALIAPFGNGTAATIFSGSTVNTFPAFGGPFKEALAINNAGVAVGFSDPDLNSRHAALFANGTTTDLGTFGGLSSSARDINDAGQIVGSAALANNVGHAFLYENGSKQDIGTLGGARSGAMGINNAGQIVGFSELAGTSDRHAFLYANGAMADLGTLGGANSIAWDINNSGQVVGESAVGPGTDVQAFLYANGMMTTLGMLGGSHASIALSINDLGQVVGHSVGSAADAGSWRAFLYTDGAMIDLNAMIDPASGWQIVDAKGINNSGQIVAMGYKAGVGTQALRLDLASPVPEPATTAMLLAGAGLLGLRSRRKGVAA
jgi:probable HAF family extracellular repeat protein